MTELASLWRRFDYDSHWVQPADRAPICKFAARTEQMGRAIRTFVPLMGLLPLALICASLLLARGSTEQKLAAFGVLFLCVLIPLIPVAFIAVRRRALSTRMAEVASTLGGTNSHDRPRGRRTLFMRRRRARPR